MKKIFKPASLLFNILSLLSFFILGLLFAGWINAGKGQMLAGGAIVLGYGVLFGGIGLILSFFVTYNVKHQIIVIGNIVFAVFILATFGYFRYKFKQNQNEQDIQRQEIEQPKKPTILADNGKLLALNNITQQKATWAKKTMGLGFFTPNFHENPVLYFYGNPNLEKSVPDHTPTDSIVFKQFEQGGFEITQAPPWLVPEHMKLDYDLLYFEIQSLGREFAEVTVNTKTRYTVYVNRRAGKIIYWPEFLLNVHSVEFLPNTNQNVKERPFKASSNVNTPFSFLHPIRIKEDWMQVYLWNDNFEKVGSGWIQWKRNGELLITYSLLS